MTCAARAACAALLAATLTPVLGGCVMCSQLAGADGLEVTFSGSVPGARTLVVEVCDDEGCGRTTQRLRARGGRQVLLEPESFGRDLVVGESVGVTAELLAASGRVVFRGQDEVRIEASQPNGALCDGDDWPLGTVEFRVG